MAENQKVRIAFFDFASCEGCQLQVLNLENELLDLLKFVEIVEFREAMSEKSDDYLIAFVEGSITKPSDIERIKKIRKNAGILIALGACATHGCVNSGKNMFPIDDVRKATYQDDAKYFDDASAKPFETFEQAMPIDAVVKVDFKIRGCPINNDEFLMIVKALLAGKKPEIMDSAVCLECQAKGIICLYDKGEICLGLVTRAGCGAWCPSNGFVCEGCRGFIDEPNLARMKEIITEHGLSWEYAQKRLELFNSWEMTKNKMTFNENNTVKK
jgi:sulfhydrogenase subunit delta